MPSETPESVTHLLRDWRDGNQQALDRLLPLVYEELRRLASKQMRGERQGHTLETTALVHEAYARLVDIEVPWSDRVHFFAVAARLMRRILVDHSRARMRGKRGAGAAKLTLDEDVLVTPQPGAELLELDSALERLAEIDERKSRVVELHFFGGMTYDETAAVLCISAATVDRDLRLAKAWLYREIKQGSGDGS